MGSLACLPDFAPRLSSIQGLLHDGRSVGQPSGWNAFSFLQPGHRWEPAPGARSKRSMKCRVGGANRRNAEVLTLGPKDSARGQGWGRQQGTITCRAGAGAAGRNNIKVVVVGVGSEIGREVVRAVQNARGMEVVGAVDRNCAGEDIGELAGLEALELPVLSDIVMVLSSVSQARDDLGVVVDVGGGGTAFDSVRQATAFALRSVIGAQELSQKELSTLVEFCEKSSMGCVAAPSFSIGEVLLQQAAVSAGFYYGQVDIEERLDPADQEAPSASVLRTAEALKGLGREFAAGSEGPADGLLKRTDAGDGLVIESRSLEGAPLRYSQHVRFQGAGEGLELVHTVNSARGYMPGLLLAIRKVVRLRSMVYGLEKIL